MTESLSSLAALRRRIATLEGRRVETRALFATGHASLDDSLGGGLAQGKLHELFGGEEDSAACAAFAILLALLAGGGTAPLLWLRTDGGERMGGGLYGPGLVDLGVDPVRLLVATMPDEAMLLRAAADALRCRALGAIVVECWGNPRILDLTASRRLTLAAEARSVTALLLRLDARPEPSAAETRWQVAAAPSCPLPADAPGRSAFDLSLLRRRSGPDGQSWRLEWNRDRRCFEQGANPALSGAVVPLPADGPAAGFAAA